ncbi:T9SS type A sorting domain-containing protein [Chryseobacterium limigenitum]|uniref:Delta-60 repeat domain-containing protein/Por secretion system C-terminal sorting domain-containing protein n=1 Tax=Chryseobacterium limigenitum TaxID=1612149 RepID=A0A1K2IZ64_9FLAO|nr:T9SS type A sorting domain-containing protein [Chryseobacterium limigenitum]SFZ97075.1 delta-60 repeat domain-containing protein/Por secretion system C-terminal sorting domain-containing protein [Chryseobacterium limigenitum]
MKTKLILLAIIAFANLTFAQILTKDTSFATNGVYISNVSPYSYFTGFAQSADGSIYFTYSPTSTTTVLTKLTSNGILDTSFGNNGELFLNYSPYSNTSLTIQSDNKIVLVCTHYDANNTYTDVIRVLPNGQLDNTFGNNGIVLIPNLFYGLTDYGNAVHGLLLQNNKLIVYGNYSSSPNSYQTEYLIYRLNSNGSIDSSFGTNGKITTTRFMKPFIDNQSNIVTFSDLDIKKYNPNGQPLTSYGNNGVQTLNFPISNSVPFIFRSAILDSSNRILYLESSSEGIKRINPDGTLDSTFNYDYFPNGISRLVNNLYEKDGFYYVCGMGELTNGGMSYFISRLTQNGSVDPAFGSFVETDPTTFNLYAISNMFVNDNSFIVADEYKIVKYLKNNATLSTTENTNNTEIQFENPVRDNLVFKTKEKINNIEIYSITGMLVKILEKNFTDVSTLLKGNYIAKVSFQNNKTKIVKIIKK